MPPSRLSPVDPDAFTDAGRFVGLVRPQDLVFFCLNVGDGDSQLLLLPRLEPGPRQAIAVDVPFAAKARALIEALQGVGLLADPPEIVMAVATHPHEDHIDGMGDFLAQYGDDVDLFWEPGFRSSAQHYKAMMDRLGQLDGIRHMQPTAGATVWIGQTRITALSPATALRNRFDSYGVGTNDASISLRVEFPTSAVVVHENGKRTYEPPPERAALVLGADSQARSWASVLNDFPKLERSGDELARALRRATGADHLSASVFKVSHHCSNRGSWLELIQEIRPRVCLITADPDRSKHGFPHMVALEGIREAMQPTATSGGDRDDDLALGIHVSGARNTDGESLGSIATVIGPGARKLDVWRFGDGRDEACVLAHGQRVRN